MARTFWTLGCLFALAAVGAGAFGAHALRARLAPDLLAVFETGARYQMYHALALLAVAWAVERWPGGSAAAAGWAFTAGIVVFSGKPVRAGAHGGALAGRGHPAGGRGLPGGVGAPRLDGLARLTRGAPSHRRYIRRPPRSAPRTRGTGPSAGKVLHCKWL